MHGYYKAALLSSGGRMDADAYTFAHELLHILTDADDTDEVILADDGWCSNQDTGKSCGPRVNVHKENVAISEFDEPPTNMVITREDGSTTSYLIGDISKRLEGNKHFEIIVSNSYSSYWINNNNYLELMKVLTTD